MGSDGTSAVAQPHVFDPGEMRATNPDAFGEGTQSLSDVAAQFPDTLTESYASRPPEAEVIRMNLGQLQVGARQAESSRRLAGP